MRTIMMAMAIAVTMFLSPGTQGRADALAGCCVCESCSGADLCDEQQTGSSQCDDFCNVQGCGEATFVGGAPNTCANGCDGNFGGSTQTPKATPTPTPVEDCGNGVDDDRDLDIDCDDSDCAGQPNCSAPAPTIAPQYLLMLAVLMALGGLAIIARRSGGAVKQI
jgi:hypothetical protein